VRVEFILRRNFLRRRSINEPHELLLLRELNLPRLIRLRDVDPKKVLAIEERGNYRQRGLCALAARSTRRQFNALMKKLGGRPPDIFASSLIEKRLSEMLSRFVW
jgi:hypothetical protein